MRTRVALFLALATLVAACAPPAQRPPTPAPTPDTRLIAQVLDSRLPAAGTHFAFQIFAELASEEAGKNLFISPLSVALALEMTYNGAAGETQQAMAQALEVQGMSLQELNEANAALRKLLANPDPQVQLSIANALWAKKGVPFRADFLARNKDYYGAGVNEFSAADARTLAEINRWVSQNTKGKIEKIVEQVDPSTVLFLVNAIYFQANWTHKFKKEDTKDAPFKLADGRQKTVPMMTQVMRFRYLDGDDFQAVRLPYGNGGISLYILLPDEGSSLAGLLPRLSAERWEEWLGKFEDHQVTLSLPRFQAEWGADLKKALSALGMGIAFEPGRADLSGMLPGGGAWIEQVQHKAVLQVDEEGTVAAAATLVSIPVSMPPPATMVVDRPFFCAIRDDRTGVVLFMGAVVEP